jgi:hypothetical protein
MKNYKKTRSLTLGILFLSISLIFSSCLKNLNSDNEPQQAAAINVVNASPGPLAFNFFLDNGIVNGPALAFGQETTYLLATTGTRKFDIASAGTVNSLLADTLSLETDKYYSVFVAGENASLSTFVTEDDVAAPASGKAKIRFINLSPDGGTLALGIKNGATLFPGQTFKTTSAFAEIDPAAYMLVLKAQDGSAAFESSVDVAAGKIYTVWAGGLKNGVDNTALKIFARASN